MQDAAWINQLHGNVSWLCIEADGQHNVLLVTDSGQPLDLDQPLPQKEKTYNSKTLYVHKSFGR